jgi:predicted nucleic acid-binding protein
MLVYLDTNIWIYAYENDPLFGVSARRLFQGLRSGKHRLASSLFVLGELLVLPTQKQNTFALASYRRLFASPEIALLPYNAAATQVYADIRPANVSSRSMPCTSPLQLQPAPISLSRTTQSSCHAQSLASEPS